jgi:hypothetical protein
VSRAQASVIERSYKRISELDGKHMCFGGKDVVILIVLYSTRAQLIDHMLACPGLLMHVTCQMAGDQTDLNSQAARRCGGHILFANVKAMQVTQGGLAIFVTCCSSCSQCGQ